MQAESTAPPRPGLVPALESSKSSGRHPWLPATTLTIAAAWLVIVSAQVTGSADGLHHHALIEGKTPLGLAVLSFLVAWQVMVVAMMWPASFPAVHSLLDRWPESSRRRLLVATFLGTSAVVWAGFGLAAFVGDMALHHVVDTTPWLGTRPWLIEAGVLATAGAYQFTPMKRRHMAACRRPGERIKPAGGPWPVAVRLGLRHSLDCLGSSWPLMLVMFAAGFASLWTMALLTLLMVYEAAGRQGQRAATASGIALLLAAVSTLSGPLSGLA